MRLSVQPRELSVVALTILGREILVEREKCQIVLACGAKVRCANKDSGNDRIVASSGLMSSASRVIFRYS